MSSLSLSKFTEVLNKSGFARNTLFIVEFNSIKADTSTSKAEGAVSTFITTSWAGDLMSTDFSDKTGLTLFVRRVNIPGTQIETKEYLSDRTPIDMPITYKNSPLKISFMCDPTYKHRQYFEEWMHAVINPVSMTAGFYDEFISNIKIKTFDVTGNIRSIMELTECYPVDVSDIELSYDEESSVVTFDVTFTYKLKYHRSVFGDSLATVEEELSKLATGKGTSDFESALQGIESIAKRAGKFVDAVIGKPLQTVRNIQSRASEVINKVYTPIAKVKSSAKQAQTVVLGSKKLLNVLKR